MNLSRESPGQGSVCYQTQSPVMADSNCLPPPALNHPSGSCFSRAEPRLGAQTPPFAHLCDPSPTPSPTPTPAHPSRAGLQVSLGTPLFQPLRLYSSELLLWALLSPVFLQREGLFLKISAQMPPPQTGLPRPHHLKQTPTQTTPSVAPPPLTYCSESCYSGAKVDTVAPSRDRCCCWWNQRL